MIRIWAPLVAFWILFLALAAALLGSRGAELPAPDLVQSNAIAQVAQEQWASLADAEFPAGDVQFTIVDSSGAVLRHRGPVIADPLAALRARAATLPVVINGERVGSVYLLDPAAAEIVADRDRALSLAATGIGIVGLLATALYVWAIARIVAPFHRLERFARDVAGGRLDVPLPMDRTNAFGAFTESFDLMRDEIARARADESAAKRSKADLVAQLSHDIRTPVSSIGATAELLELGEHDQARRDKITIIRTKTVQIDELIGELFLANAERIGELSAHVESLPSRVIEPMLRAADTDGMIGDCNLDDALVDLDQRRLQQVLDNLLDNARKYGAAPIEVTGAARSDRYVLAVRDHGPGVPDDEIDLLTAKGYRGTNAAARRGYGLGLHTAAQLSAAMGGELTVAHGTPGLRIEIVLALSR